MTFEAGATDGIPLGDRIAEAATGAPGALPLLSYLLEQLYQADVVDGGTSMLTYASYDSLGGLRGSIAARAGAIFCLGKQPRCSVPSGLCCSRSFS